MQKATLSDGNGNELELDGKLNISAKGSGDAEKLKADLKAVQEAYAPRGNPMTGLSLDLIAELTQRGWKLKVFRTSVGAAEEFLESASALAEYGRYSEQQLKGKTGLELHFSSPARRKIHLYRMSTLSLAFACEAYINQYGAERLGDNDFSSFDKLPVEDKWIVIPRVVTGKSFDKGKEPFQTLKKLIEFRNGWVHHKPYALTMEIGKTFTAEGKQPAAIPETYAAVTKNIKQAYALIGDLHALDSSPTYLYGK